MLLQMVRCDFALNFFARQTFATDREVRCADVQFRLTDRVVVVVVANKLFL